MQVEGYFRTMIRTATLVGNVGRFRRRCGWQPCGEMIGYDTDADLSRAPVLIYCADGPCAELAMTRKRTLQRLLLQIERDLSELPSRSEDAKKRRRWRRLAMWELGLPPGTPVKDLEIPPRAGSLRKAKP